MADISQVKLPDGTTYNLKDSYVRTNYRALNNNDFDTINVTELNTGDLIVTGAARFLNTINGSISGNAVTATKATQDESGNNIKATYAASFSISDHTITLKNKNGVSLGTVTVPDNNDNTWRKVQVNGTDILGTATNTNPLNLKAGTNVSLSNSSGTVTITATDTNTTYSLSADTTNNKITLTPSSGSAQSITVPYATKATQDGSGNTITSTYLPLAGGQMTGDIIIPKNDNMGIKPNTNNYGEIGHSNLYFYRSFITHYYGTTSHVTNWDSNGNIGASATSSAASTRGYVNFYNTCAAGGTQTKTTLYAHTDADANTNILLPKNSGTLITNNDICPTVLGTNSYGVTTDNSSKKIKIKINPTNYWMLCFVVTLYQSYDATRIMISGYNYNTTHWYQPLARVLGSTKTGAIKVYFGYDADTELWVGFDGASYTGITIDSVTNGYQQITDYKDMFTISFEDSLTTLQDTKTVYRPWYRDETVDLSTKTNMLNGFSNGGAGNITWGNQTGTGIWYNNDANGGSVGFRTNNPASGQVSMIIDGTVYIKEGAQDVSAAVKSFSVSGQTVTYTNLWGGTGTFTTQDTKNTAGSTDTSSKIFLVGATSQAANPQTYSDDQVYVTSGTLQANSISATTNVTGLSLGVSSITGTTGGISLYGGVGNVTSYGIAMRGTGNGGKHGAVQGDWAIYNYMLNYGGHRGWIWKNSASDGGNVASIDCLGNAVFNGYVGIGGNTTNTSGVRQVYNSTTKSLDFVFVA